MGIIIFLLLVIIVILTGGWALIPIFAVLAAWGTWALITIAVAAAVVLITGIVAVCVMAFRMRPVGGGRASRKAYRRVKRMRPEETLQQYTERMRSAGILPRHTRIWEQPLTSTGAAPSLPTEQVPRTSLDNL